MKKQILSLALALILTLALSPASQVRAADTPTAPAGFDLIPLEERYVGVGSFQDGMAHAHQASGKSGYVNAEGKLVIPTEYFDAGSFSHGMAPVWKNETSVSGLSGVAVNLALIDKTGKEIVPSGRYTRIWHNDVYGSDDSVAVVFRSRFEPVDWNTFHEQPIEVRDEYTWRWRSGIGEYAVINNTGKEIVPLGKYTFIDSFSNGFAQVYNAAGLCGYINTSGVEVIPCQYTYASGFSSFVCSYDEGEWYGDGNGTLVAQVTNQKGETYIIDSTGKRYTTKGSYKILDKLVPDGSTHGRWVYGVLNTKTGQQVVPYAYDKLSDIDNDGNYQHLFVTVNYENHDIYGEAKYGIIDASTGKEIIPPKYAMIRDFIGNLAVVFLDPYPSDKCGVIDFTTGKEILPPVYNSVTLTEDVIWASKPGTTRESDIFDRTGKLIVPAGKYKNTAPKFYEGYLAVSDGNLWGFIDTQGHEVVPPMFDKESHVYFNNGVVLVALNVNRSGANGVAADRSADWYFLVDKTKAQREALATADIWAHAHINEASAKGFLPPSLQGHYKANITRAEFVLLAMSWLRYKTGLTTEQLVAQYAAVPDRTFSDVTNTDILAAGKLDITAGAGGGLFGVNDTFSRQQAAVMLTKVYRILGEDDANAPEFGFLDAGKAESWARNAINYVKHKGVMNGVGDGTSFDPLGLFQRQQSIIVFNQMG